MKSKEFCRRSIEQFMRDYIGERTAAIRADIARHAPFRQKFYVDGCRFDRHRGVPEASEAEEILNVTFSDSEAEVMTSGFETAQRRSRLRYRLQFVGEKWLIQYREVECRRCSGNGKEKDGVGDCLLCNGKGWVNPEAAAPVS